MNICTPPLKKYLKSLMNSARNSFDTCFKHIRARKAANKL